MKIISIRFYCGHFENQSAAEIKKQKIAISPIYQINGQDKAESEQYCLNCSKMGKYSFDMAANK